MIKKLILLSLTLTAILLPPLAAQTEADTASTADPKPTPWRLGITVGANYNYHQAPQAYTTYRYTPSIGLMGGLTARYYFLPWLGVRADLMMMMKNYLQSNMITLDDQEQATFSTIHLNQYAMLPIMADFSLGKKVRFHGGLGFYVGYWVSWSRMGQAISFMTFAAEEYDENASVVFNKVSDNRFNAGLAGSLGLSFPLGKHLEGSAEVNGYYDLTDSKKVYSRNHFPQYNTSLALQLGLCYKF